MPTISTFYGILIQMFWNDHAPPHFHALYAEYGFSLPDDPVHRVKAMFDLAMALFNPALSLPLEGLRNHHPLAAK